MCGDLGSLKSCRGVRRHSLLLHEDGGMPDVAPQRDGDSRMLTCHAVSGDRRSRRKLPQLDRQPLGIVQARESAELGHPLVTGLHVNARGFQMHHERG